MEEKREELELTPEKEELQQEEKAYSPRPTWQVWAARIGLVIFLIILLVYYGIMFAGGGR